MVAGIATRPARVRFPPAGEYGPRPGQALGCCVAVAHAQSARYKYHFAIVTIDIAQIAESRPIRPSLAHPKNTQNRLLPGPNNLATMLQKLFHYKQLVAQFVQEQTLQDLGCCEAVAISPSSPSQNLTRNIASRPKTFSKQAASVVFPEAMRGIAFRANAICQILVAGEIAKPTQARQRPPKPGFEGLAAF